MEDKKNLGPGVIHDYRSGLDELRMEEDLEYKLNRDIDSEAKFRWPLVDTPDHAGEGVPGYVKSKRVCGLARKFCQTNLGQAHRMADLVIREYAGQNFLAAFVTFFDHKSIETQRIYRPYTWLLMDYVTGDIIHVFETNLNEFSSAPYEQPLSAQPDGTYDLSEEHYREIYAILDEVRGQELKGEGFNKERYQEYLGEIKANTPKDFHVFFDDLSAPKTNSTPL